MRIKVTFDLVAEAAEILKDECETIEMIEKAFGLFVADLFAKEKSLYAFKTIETEVEE